MSGSSGQISGVNIAPSNHYQQNQKNIEGQTSAFPSTLAAIKPIYARVINVDPKRPKFAQVRGRDNHAPVGQDGWIELDHSVKEIAERWGTIRRGFIVRVLTYGLGETGAFGTIVGTEGARPDDVGVKNEVGRGLYAVFAPGVGIG